MQRRRRSLVLVCWFCDGGWEAEWEEGVEGLGGWSGRKRRTGSAENNSSKAC